jgi:photosystem II stability/assembly factor-like uncharacterized protein
MRLVDSSSSPFASVGAGPQTGDLECITASVCYASDTSGSAPAGSGVERTVDGGATWSQTAFLPDGAALSWPLSCPMPDTCIGVARTPGSDLATLSQLRVAVTTDGGDAWTIDPVSTPPGLSGASIDQIACATAQACVVHIFNGAEGSAAAGTFLSTNDGGKTWVAASMVPPAASSSLWTLRCDPDGDCIGLTPVGTVQSPATEGLVTLRSTDNGHTWTATSSPLAVGAGILLLSCGDALHCLAAYPAAGGATIALATTADGGASWRVTAPPTSWPDIAISVSCATGLDCFVSAANSTHNGYDDPVIEATHDGGNKWTSLALPTVGATHLALVYPLDCPVAVGCIGVGATPAEFEPPRSLPTTGSIPANGERVIISNLFAVAG